MEFLVQNQIKEEETMKYLRKPARIVFLIVLCLVTIVSVAKLSKATGVIGKEDLAGPWQIALQGNTGCGSNALLWTGTLNASGVGTGTLVSHSTGCANSSSTESFTITSLSSNGSGKATLACGTGCGWDLTIQVSPDRTTMNLVDVDPLNPLNTPAGMGVHQ
jgi:hypothetical protein